MGLPRKSGARFGAAGRCPSRVSWNCPFMRQNWAIMRHLAGLGAAAIFLPAPAQDLFLAGYWRFSSPNGWTPNVQRAKFKWSKRERTTADWPPIFWNGWAAFVPISCPGWSTASLNPLRFGGPGRKRHWLTGIRELNGRRASATSARTALPVSCFPMSFLTLCLFIVWPGTQAPLAGGNGTSSLTTRILPGNWICRVRI